jgi:protein MPE1
LNRTGDFDLVIINAQSKEEYTDDYQMIPRNTNVLVKRVPSWMLANGQYFRLQKQQRVGAAATQEASKRSNMSMPATDDELLSPEEKKIREMAQASSESWQQQLSLQESYGKQRPVDTRSGASGIRLNTTGDALSASSTIQPAAPGYICHRCGEKGHYISECPLFIANPSDKTRLKRAAGIPKTFLQAAAEDGSELKKAMLSQEGFKVVYRPNQHEWNKLHSLAAKTKEHVEDEMKRQNQEAATRAAEDAILMQDEDSQQALKMPRKRQPGVAYMGDEDHIQ